VNDRVTQGLQVYIVGGAVRDALLGLPAGDRDWVVVGASPAMMVQRGFLPVGRDFPVFLHPETHEEYALARTERKSGRGYHGFTFYTGRDVTLEDDLKRRDLTINAMARDVQGRLIDPLQGARDVQQRVLRHVGAAFAEDPVRILRLARFMARFSDFIIAPATLALCRDMVTAGEVDALVPERVWKELSRGLMADQPSRLLQVLDAVQALSRLMPGLQTHADLEHALDQAAQRDLSLPCRYALLCRASAECAVLSAHLHVSTECRDYARLLPAVLSGLQALQRVDMTTAGADGRAAVLSLNLLEQCDALRKPQRFIDLLHTAAVLQEVPVAVWAAKLRVLHDMDAGAIARQCEGNGDRIKAALRLARLNALQVYSQ
jgi:tRNA nucleotidyltransferase (CCA-adding enzyme)